MIRPFGLRDVFRLRQLGPRGVAFDLRRWGLSSQSPTHAALLGLLSHHHLGNFTWVQNTAGAGATSALAQVAPRPNRAEWDLVFLSPSLDDRQGAVGLWQDLLNYLIIRGAQLGVERVYARCSEDPEAEDALRQAGFAVASREEIFVFAEQSAPAVPPKGLRPLDREDARALQELCSHAEPQYLHKIEWPPLRTACLPSSSLARDISLQEFIWIGKGKAFAYFGLLTGASAHWLEVVVRPEHRAELLPFIRYILTLSGCSSSAPMYCPVPDHGVGLGLLLRTLGFSAYARQVLLVAHTMARATLRRPRMIPGLEGSVDVGARVGRLLQPSSSKDRLC